MPSAHYQLVSGRSLREVREHAARLEKEGYRPFGRAYKTIAAPDGKLDGNRFFQAMLKEERLESESEVSQSFGHPSSIASSFRK